jgi:hypothetical protein
MTTSPTFVRPDPLAAAAADATATLAQMAADHHTAPEQQLTRARQRQAMLRNDAELHLEAGREISQLEAKVARGDTPGALLSDQERLDLALGGQLDHLGAEVTAGDQVPVRDFNGAIADDIKLGVPRDLLKAYHSTGKSDDPMGHVAANIWLSRFSSDPEWQLRFDRGDLEMRRRHKIAHYYIAGAHSGVSPQAEADYRARFSAY